MLTGTAETENALHDVESPSAFRDRRETNKGILRCASSARYHPNFCDVEWINVDPAEGISGEMIHGEVEDIAQILLSRVLSQIRDCDEDQC